MLVDFITTFLGAIYIFEADIFICEQRLSAKLQSIERYLFCRVADARFIEAEFLSFFPSFNSKEDGAQYLKYITVIEFHELCRFWLFST